MLEGTGHPIIIIGGVAYDLPEPIKGGRNEGQEDQTTIRKNARYRNRRGKERFRFLGDYAFIKLERTLYNSIDRALTRNKQKCIWIPYSDIPRQKFECHALMTQINKTGYVNTKSAKISLEEIGTRNRRMNADDLITGRLKLRGIV